jgi:hypothetical protein
MPYNENEPITTQDVLDAIITKNWDGARERTKDILYKKAGEEILVRKNNIANNIAKSNTEPETQEMPSGE